MDIKRITGLITLTILVTGVLCQGPQVDIPGMGVVEGLVSQSEVSNRDFYMFRGIPYGAPPSGALRFQPPVAAEPWDGILDATKVGPECPQISGLPVYKSWSGTDDGKVSDDLEDCLYIHVYTPTLDPNANLPVIVFYHGGGFRIGSASAYGSGRFMDEDVVLVFPHYRLGPLGFLSLHTDDIPGNAGMLDQVFALNWVHQYISVFGGDASQITVMGESAGGVISSMLAVSPLSTGLFSRYIAQSGTAAAEWALDPDPIRSAMEVGRFANCSDFDIPALTECLMTTDPMTLLIAHDMFQRQELAAGGYLFAGSAPVLQQAGSVRFIEEDPREIFKNGNYEHKAALLGSNKHEGTLVYACLNEFYLNPNGLLEDEVYMRRGITNFLLDFFGVMDQGETLAVGIEKSYIGLENMGNLTKMVPGLVDYLGDMFIKGPVLDNAILNTKFAKTYKYSFNFFGSSSLWGLFGIPEIIDGGVAHANDLIYLFNFPGFILNAQEREISRQMIKLWTNFAIYGEPNPAANPVEGVPSWPEFNTVDSPYLRIDREMALLYDFTKNEYFVAKNEGFPYPV